MFKWFVNHLIMDKSSESSASSGITAPYKAHRRKFFSCITKWFYSDATYEDTANLDISDLVIILQSLGFKLQRFEKIENSCKSGDLKVEIKCGISDYEAVLSIPNPLCKCPTVNNEEFWEVTGSGPCSLKSASSNVINEAGSSLIPPVSKGTTSVVRDVMKCLITLIQSPPDVNQNTEECFSSINSNSNGGGATSNYRFGAITAINNHLNLSQFTQKRRHSLESILTSVSLSSELRAIDNVSNALSKQMMTKSCTNAASGDSLFETPKSTNNATDIPKTPSKLIREKTWDLDPPSKPTTSSEHRPTSSPVPQICTGISNLSLSQDKNLEIATLLRETRRNVDKALRILATSSKSKTPQSGTKKIPVAKTTPPTRKNVMPVRSLTPTLQKLNTSAAITKRTSLSMISSKYAQPRLSVSTSNISRPNTAPRALQRPTITAKRRVSPEFGGRGDSSSAASSTHSISSSANNLTVEFQKPMRHSFGYLLPRTKNSSSSSATTSPLFPKKVLK